VARIRYLGLLAIGACASAVTGEPDVVVDARQDATPCAIQTYYKDADGDGHGTATMAVQACTPPAGTVTSNDDCDDNNPQRYPGNAEICDVIDNDCNAATAEQATCPTGCTPMRRPAPDDARAYLFCNTLATWPTAAATCAGAMYKLVQIESAAENAFVRASANIVFPTVGVNLHLGGNDLVTEGTWMWDGGSAPFWQGTSSGSGGGPVMNRYANWDPDEPNNSGNAEDCSEMKIDGTWNDGSCANSFRFACRR
jgi:Lectin C-type domain/Putative metal-binding motif